MKKTFTLLTLFLLVGNIYATIQFTEVFDQVTNVSDVYYDLDLDGDNDFSFSLDYVVSGHKGFVGCPKPSSQYAADGTEGNTAKAYAEGAGLGTYHWEGTGGLLVSYDGDGYFNNTTKYLMVKFTDATHTYYGWFKVSNSGSLLIIEGYAYNDVPDESITAGQTSTGIANISAPAPILAETSRGTIAFKNCEQIDKAIVYSIEGKVVAEILSPRAGNKYTLQQATGIILVTYFKNEEVVYTSKYFVE